MKQFKIKMGAKVKDSVTDFRGVVTARAEYLTGCRQYLVQPKADKGKFVEGNWFDEDRLLDSIPKKRNNGGPQSFAAPVK